MIIIQYHTFSWAANVLSHLSLKTGIISLWSPLAALVSHTGPSRVHSVSTQKKLALLRSHGGLLHWKADHRQKADPLPQPKAHGRMQRVQWQHL